MSRPFSYDLSPERIEELFNTVMNEEEKSMWKSCNEFLQRYSGASKQLVDIRMREWNDEYNHDPMKTLGGIRHNCCTKRHANRKYKDKAYKDDMSVKNEKRVIAALNRFKDPEQYALQKEYCKRASRKHAENCKNKHTSKTNYTEDNTEYEMPIFNLNKESKEYNTNIII